MNARASLRLSDPNPPFRLSPPLKWAGGKRWLVPALEVLYAPYRGLRLVEPFAGGLAVALGLMPERALLADINPHAINFYSCLKRGLVTSLKMRNDRASYDRNRRRFNNLIRRGRHKSPEAAALFYYLNCTGFNGLCRFNSEGLFNVPFGRYTTINYTREFSAYQDGFAGLRFRCSDFEKLTISDSDFVYADPPYDVDFTRSSSQDFTWNDQVRLAEWLRTLEGPVVASNQATSRVCDLYRGLGFALILADAPRMISCNGDRSKAKEILAVRNISATVIARAKRVLA